MNEMFEGIVRSIGEIPDSVVLDGTQSFVTDLNIDSLKLLDIVVNVEAEFGIEIENLHQYTTVGELWQRVELLVAEREAQSKTAAG